MRIDTEKFSAALTHVPKKSTLNYLLGLFARHDGEYLYLSATDGSRLFVGRIEQHDTSAFPGIIIPRDIAKLALSMKLPCITLSHDNAAWTLNGIPFLPVDGEYPDINRIIPATTSGEIAQFKPEYICDAHAALCRWHGSAYHHYAIQYNGNRAAVMAGDSAFVVIMPRNYTLQMLRGTPFKML